MERRGGVGQGELHEPARTIGADPDGQRQVAERDAPAGSDEADGGLALVAAAEGVGGAGGHHPAAGDHRHRVGQGLGLVHVVGGEHHGAALGAQAPHQVPRLAAGRGVEPGGGLVEEDQLGVADRASPRSSRRCWPPERVLTRDVRLGLEAHQLDDLVDAGRGGR